jgi:hypothetical protein
MVAFLVAGGLLQQPIREESEKTEFLTSEGRSALARSPQMAVLTQVPGGLRVLAINYFWIRAQQAHQEGRHFDAYQLAEIICELQPYQPGVWGFQAWNMAWNISVTTQTPQERWRWVYNGVKLLRDRGISYNPRSLQLYKELSWIFLSKIGGQLDDMHWSYKQRWAGMMQELLGAPPYDDSLEQTLAEETQMVIRAFAAVADEKFLDKSPLRQGVERIQADRRKAILAAPAIRAYADRLAALGVEVDEGLLRTYNRYSLDQAAAAVRNQPPQPKTDAEKALFKAVNDPAAAKPRATLLAFVRAQLLWNVYRMDPAFMLELMQRYKVPLDWRHSMSHALYWAAYGIKICQPDDSDGILALNNERNVLNSLKTLTATGVVTMAERPENPNYPLYDEYPDLRYIEPTNEQHKKYIADLLRVRPGKKFEENVLAAGHVNYLVEAINMLAADGRIKTAQKYFDYIREDYKKTGPEWDFTSVEDFVVDNISREGTLRYVVAVELLRCSLRRAFLARGLRGGKTGQQEYNKRMKFAMQLYNTYQKQAPERLKLPRTFKSVSAMFLMQLLARPRMFGVSLSANDRSDIYMSMKDQPEILVPIYHRLEKLLRRLCETQGLDFDRAFPAPAGLKEYREKLKETMPKP